MTGINEKLDKLSKILDVFSGALGIKQKGMEIIDDIKLDLTRIENIMPTEKTKQKVKGIIYGYGNVYERRG